MSDELEALDEEWDSIITAMQPKGWGSVTMNFAFAWPGAVKSGPQYREFYHYLIEQGRRINATKDLKTKEEIVDETWTLINETLAKQKLEEVAAAEGGESG